MSVPDNNIKNVFEQREEALLERGNEKSSSRIGRLLINALSSSCCVASENREENSCAVVTVIVQMRTLLREAFA